MPRTKLSDALFTIITLMACTAASSGDAVRVEGEVANFQKVSNVTQQVPLAGPMDALDVQNMPAIVPATNAQSVYVAQLVESVVGVVSGQRPLATEERSLLGAGEFFVPKDQRQAVEVTRLYPQDNFRVRFVSLSLVRPNREAPWTMATLTVQPKNAPVGAYRLELPSALFSRFRRLKSSAEDRPANGKAPAHRVHVFDFSYGSGESAAQLTFECRRDLCDLNAPFPPTFHMLKVTRSG